ncbi:15195_t:CDS:2 [Dentiscutata erythropus]|uniref:15195_t:CDS:1 n=1 Tax=Dentiscutata erythropus TaxID=1348616 RepID=A0A9N9I879_9GLOM|nr:15195_t:CDS:2 [Dentiscutata erythropus]
MLNSAVQASVNFTECLISSKSSKYEKPKENYPAFFHPKNRKKDQEIIKQTLSGGRGDLNSGCKSGGRGSPYLSLYIDNKNLFFLKNRPTEAYYLERQKDFLFSHLVWREKGELDDLLAKRPYQFKKKWQEIKLKTEILSKWDNPAKLVAEPKNRSLAALAFTHEIVLGKVDVPLLDLDPNKKDEQGNYRIKQEWLRKALVTGEKIGDLLSDGDLVALPVGGDKNRHGKVEERVEEVLNRVDLSLEKSGELVQKSRKSPPIIKEHLTKNPEQSVKRLRREIKISGKQKTCLEDI